MKIRRLLLSATVVATSVWSSVAMAETEVSSGTRLPADWVILLLNR